MLIPLFLVESALVNRIECCATPAQSRVQDTWRVTVSTVHTWRGDVASHGSPHDRLSDQQRQEGDKAASPH